MERLTVLPLLVPVPVRLTDCGLPVALSVTLTAAVRVAGGAGREGHTDRTVGSRRDASAAIVGLRKVTAVRAGNRDGRNAERRAAAVGEGHCLSAAGGSSRLAGECQAGGRQPDQRRRVNRERQGGVSGSAAVGRAQRHRGGSRGGRRPRDQPRRAVHR